MDFFTALATIRKEFPHLDESELRSALRCGGLSRSLETILAVVRGQY
jgi:hypothetical protein